MEKNINGYLKYVCVYTHRKNNLKSNLYYNYNHNK